MTSRTVSVSVDATPEQVWSLLADLERMPEWSPEVVAVRWLDGATRPAPGARFKGSNRRTWSWSTTCTITEADPGRALAWAVGKGETTWRFDVEPEADGVRVSETFTIVKEPGVIGRWLTKPSTGVTWAERPDDLAAGAQTTLERLRATAEAGR